MGEPRKIGGVPVWFLLVFLGPVGWVLLVIRLFVAILEDAVRWVTWRLGRDLGDEDLAPVRRRYRRIR